jgi:hypothetical protein
MLLMVPLLFVIPVLGKPALFAATLDDIPPAWGQSLPGAARFKLVMGSTAVLDKETGLVWERSPDTATRNWTASVYYCFGKQVGRRKGWRLPAFEELMSLVDFGIDVGSAPRLPAGHPFKNVQPSYYWSATTDVVDPQEAWIVGIGNGGGGPNRKTGTIYTWCVRAGRGYDGQ